MTDAPRFIPPMLATLVDRVPEGDDWIFERKLDGIRLIAVRDGDHASVWSRNGIDRSRGFPELVDALLDQECTAFVADGEVVAFDGHVTSFGRLQERSGLDDPERARAAGVAVHLYLFDLLHLDGTDLVDQPLRRRKRLLRDELRFRDPLRFTPHRNAPGGDHLASACARGWEGLIAKKATGRYVSSRSRDWRKLTCVHQQELVIGGWTDPRGDRVGLGALLVGHHDGDELVYAGRIGTGFDTETLRCLHDALVSRERATSPFGRESPSGRGLHWATPDLVCEAAFTEWTDDGKLRHPRYLGLRDDKDPSEVVRETTRG